MSEDYQRGLRVQVQRREPRGLLGLRREPMSREQMKKLLSEETNEERLERENKDLHMVAEQATQRGMKAEAEVERLREDLEGMKEDASWYIKEVNRLRRIEEAAKRMMDAIDPSLGTYQMLVDSTEAIKALRATLREEA